MRDAFAFEKPRQSFRTPTERELLSLGWPRTRLERVRTAKLARRAEGRMPGVRESGQREGHPAWRLPGGARQVRESGPGFSIGHRATASCVASTPASMPSPARAKRHRHPCRCPLRGLVVPDSPPHRGVKSALSPQPSPPRSGGEGAKSFHAASFSQWRSHCVPSARHDGARRSGAPLQRRAGGGKARRVAGMDAGQFVVRAGCPVDKPRSLHAYLADRMSARRGSGVAFLFGYFLFGHAKRK